MTKRIKLTPTEKIIARRLWLKKNKNRFQCKMCNYGSCNNSNLQVHYKRKKHLNNLNRKNLTEINKKRPTATT